jgi:hypothetical protein
LLQLAFISRQDPRVTERDAVSLPGVERSVTPDTVAAGRFAAHPSCECIKAD